MIKVPQGGPGPDQILNAMTGESWDWFGLMVWGSFLAWLGLQIGWKGRGSQTKPVYVDSHSKNHVRPK